MDNDVRKELTKLQKRVASTEVALFKMVDICTSLQAHVEVLNQQMTLMAKTYSVALERTNPNLPVVDIIKDALKNGDLDNDLKARL